MRHRASAFRPSIRGFTLVEMIVVSLLLLIAMIGLLAVFDASARINKNETDVADAQGAVRYGVYKMTRVIRMAGSGGLYVTQAVLNHRDTGLAGINVSGGPGGTSYDNVVGATIDPTVGPAIRVRDGTDIIEIRGVIDSPLIGFDQQTGCNGCTASDNLNALPIVGDPIIGEHVNNNAALRPQFAAIDGYTATASGANPMLVVVQDGNSDLHTGCSDPNPGGVQRYPQPVYNVGVLTNPTTLVASNTFGSVDFGATLGQHFNAELPSRGSTELPLATAKVRRAGVLDDIVFFIGLLPVAQDPLGQHPYLAQGIRRGDRFEVTPLADDVEDMQVAYGVDGNGDSAITRLIAPAPPNDADPNFSTQANQDEWWPNVDTERVFVDDEFQAQDPFISSHSGIPPANHCPLLHAVMVSLLAKARDPDPTYRGPAAKGYKIMNSAATPIGPGSYRRRVQTLKINLRNYAFQG